MAEIDILEEETTTFDASDEARKNRMAADDLRRIEEEVKQEAEASVEDFDDEGDEIASVRAAGTAFDFDEAQGLTESIEDESEQRMDDES